MGIMGPRMIAGTIPKLERMKEDHPEIKETIDRKIAQNKARAQKFQNHQRVYEEVSEKTLKALDTLDEVLTTGGGPFICGQEYSLADVLFTCFLASH